MWIILAIAILLAVVYGIKAALLFAAVVAAVVFIWWIGLLLCIAWHVGSKFK